MDRDEILNSIATCAADIQRWVLQMALTGRNSRDRIIDIENASKRISELNLKLVNARNGGID